MFLPNKNHYDLWDEFFDNSFFTTKENHFMKTDIKEKKNEYIIEIDLPGYQKENIKVELENGYLVIEAKTNETKEHEEEKIIRKERYYGECSRKFYVGNDIKEEDIKAKFSNGTLRLCVPKKEQQKEIENKRTIEIDD